ncbi:hypothetical protein L226DRAFT_263917 [Lentinus tigrinus ALCF2SS1-7]|uniref:uncharacterized protein n=1 Tax=Lentinus tigrinus ALCF2SS1-7 TaxID=1328758 RepID=UPI00116620F2|nr:hypothetical protein L226DRAFT_263917 [Lentinus tigrinus ALCF2SS1-7]
MCLPRRRLRTLGHSDGRRLAVGCQRGYEGTLFRAQRYPRPTAHGPTLLESSIEPGLSLSTQSLGPRAPFVLALALPSPSPVASRRPGPESDGPLGLTRCAAQGRIPATVPPSRSQVPSAPPMLLLLYLCTGTAWRTHGRRIIPGCVCVPCALTAPHRTEPEPQPERARPALRVPDTVTAVPVPVLCPVPELARSHEDVSAE